MPAPLRLGSPTRLHLLSPASTTATFVASPPPTTATMVASPIHASPELDIIEAITDAERWLSMRGDFADVDSSVPEIDHIIHESLKPLETYEVAGHHDTQMWIIERLVALRKCAQGFGIEVTELSTAIHLRLKAMMEMRTIVKQVVYLLYLFFLFCYQDNDLIRHRSKLPVLAPRSLSPSTRSRSTAMYFEAISTVKTTIYALVHVPRAMISGRRVRIGPLLRAWSLRYRYTSSRPCTLLGRMHWCLV